MPLTGPRAEDTDIQMLADALRRIRRLEQRTTPAAVGGLSWFVIDDSTGVASVTNASSPNFQNIVPDVGVANANVAGSLDAASVFFYHATTGQIDVLVDGTYVFMAYVAASGLPVGSTVTPEFQIPSSGPFERTNSPDDGAGNATVEFTAISSPIPRLAGEHIRATKFWIDAPSYGGTFSINHWAVKAVRLGGHGGDTSGFAIS